MYTIDLTMVIIVGTSLVGLIALGVFVLIGMKIAKGGRSSKGQMPQDAALKLMEVHIHSTHSNQMILKGREDLLRTSVR